MALRLHQTPELPPLRREPAILSSPDYGRVSRQRARQSQIPRPASSPERAVRRRQLKRRSVQDLSRLPELPSFIGRRRKAGSEDELSSSPKRQATEAQVTPFRTHMSPRSETIRPARPTVHTPVQPITVGSSPPSVGEPPGQRRLENLSPIGVAPILQRLDRMNNQISEMETQIGGNPQNQSQPPRSGPEALVPDLVPSIEPASGQNAPNGPADQTAALENENRYRKKDWERDAVLISMMGERRNEELFQPLCRFISQNTYAMAKGVVYSLTAKKIDEYRKILKSLLPDGDQHWKMSDPGQFNEMVRNFKDGYTVRESGERIGAEHTPLGEIGREEPPNPRPATAVNDRQPVATTQNPVGFINSTATGPSPFSFDLPAGSLDPARAGSGANTRFAASRERYALDRAHRAEQQANAVRDQAARSLREQQEKNQRLEEANQTMEQRLRELEAQVGRLSAEREFRPPAGPVPVQVRAAANDYGIPPRVDTPLDDYRPGGTPLLAQRRPVARPRPVDPPAADALEDYRPGGTPLLARARPTRPTSPRFPDRLRAAEEEADDAWYPPQDARRVPVTRGRGGISLQPSRPHIQQLVRNERATHYPADRGEVDWAGENTHGNHSRDYRREFRYDDPYRTEPEAPTRPFTAQRTDAGTRLRHREEGSFPRRGGYTSRLDPARDDRAPREDRGPRMRAQDFMPDGFDPGKEGMSVEFLINRINALAPQYGEQAIVNILPLVMRGRALDWYNSLNHHVQAVMASDLEFWIQELRQEFKQGQIESWHAAKKLTWSFESKDSITEYLTKKAALLRTAGEKDDAAILTWIWEGLPDELANGAPVREGDSLSDYRQRVKEQEPGARRIWEKTERRQRKDRYSDSSRDSGKGYQSRNDRSDSARSNSYRKDSGTKPETKPAYKPKDRAATSGTQGKGGRSGRKPPRPCHVVKTDGKTCGGDHWENDCPHKQSSHFLDEDVSDGEYERLQEAYFSSPTERGDEYPAGRLTGLETESSDSETDSKN